MDSEIIAISLPMDDINPKANDDSEIERTAGRKNLSAERQNGQNGVMTFILKDIEDTLSRSMEEPPSHPSEALSSEDREDYYVKDDEEKSGGDNEKDERQEDLVRKSEENNDTAELGDNMLTVERIQEKHSRCTCLVGSTVDVSKMNEMEQFVDSALSSPKQRVRLQGQTNRKPRMVVKPNQDRLPIYHPHDRTRSLLARDVWQTKVPSSASPSSRASDTMGQLLASAGCSLQAEVTRRGSVASMDARQVSSVGCNHESQGSPSAVGRQVAKVLHLPVTPPAAATAPVTCAGLLLRGGSGSGRRGAHAHSRTNDSDIYATIKAPRLKEGGLGGLMSADEVFLRPRSFCQPPAMDRSTMSTIHVYYAPRSTVEDVFVRVMLSTAFALIVAAIALLWTHLYLCYALTTSIVISGLLFLTLTLALFLSRACRCVSTLILPSTSTPVGRLSLIIVTSALLLTGPCDNIYGNVEEAARAIGCSVERGYNQTLMLLEPFDDMMGHVNRTIAGLQDSARGVVSGLRPLDEGLADIESDLDNGRRQLFGTEKTCRNLVERSFNSCASGIRHARSQCLSVIGALGSVYHHARGILDTINPDRWAPKQQQQLLQKRQTLRESDIADLKLPDDEANICEPLNVRLVCQSLNDSDLLCQPSKWAGDAIHEAINATQTALRDLDDALHFRLTSEPYHIIRRNASAVTFRIRQRVLEEFTSCTAHFRLVVGILAKLALPVSLLLVLRETYVYMRLFLTSLDFDNVYIADEFRALDGKLPERAFGARSILPLRKYELRYMVDTSSWKFGHTESGLHWKGMAVVVLFCVVSLSCFGFDLVLYWVLTLAQKHSNQDDAVDGSGSEGLRLVVSGQGIIVELLDLFLKGFEPDRWLAQYVDAGTCLPSPLTPSVQTAVLVFVFHVVLLLSVLLKAYSFRARNRIVGHFYPDRRKQRAVHLYRTIQCRRPHLPGLLRQVARVNHRVRERLQWDSLFSWCLVHAPCRDWLQLRRGNTACLVCECVLRESDGQECVFQRCGGTYCFDCFEDLGRICPVCLPPSVAAAEVDLDGDSDGCCLWEEPPSAEPGRCDRVGPDAPDSLRSSKVFCSRTIFTD